MHELHQLVRCLQLFGGFVKLIFTHADKTTDLTLHQSHVTHGLYHITSARLSLRADHRGTFCDTAQSLTEVFGTTDEGYVELGLIDMVDIVGWTQHLTLVDIVDLDGLQDLCLCDMTNAAFRHYGDTHGFLNATNHLGITHAGDTTSGTDIGWDALKGHHGAGTCCLGDTSLFGGCYIHNHTAFEHLCQLAVKVLSVCFHCFANFLS